VGIIEMVGVFFVGSVLFGVPLRGPLWVVGLGGVFYVFTTLGFGILLGTFAGSQQQAMLGAFAFILPGALLSGFFSPIQAMPEWLRPVTLANPMRHFLEIVRGGLLKGEGFIDLLPQLCTLLGIGLAVLGISVARFRKRLA
jgi:ABC-2 type transport system permease protein